MRAHVIACSTAVLLLSAIHTACAEEIAPLPADLRDCAAIFAPIGAPADDDGGQSFVFADGYRPEGVPNPYFRYKCYGASFAVRMNAITRVPDWAAEELTRETSEGDAPRSARFFDENDPSGYSSLDADFDGAGFDRGHQAPAGDFSGDSEVKRQTFYMSNMGPQVGPCFNRGIWRNLEAAVKSLLVTRGRLIVFTGPIYGRTLKTIGDFGFRKDVRIAVPEAYFKIVYAPQTNRAAALVIPNTAHCGEDFHATEFTSSIAAIEEKTGFRFFPDLPARAQTILKLQVVPFWTW